MRENRKLRVGQSGSGMLESFCTNLQRQLWTFLNFYSVTWIGLLQVFTQPNLIKDHKSRTSTPPVGVLVAQLCPTLWDSMDCSPPDCTVHGIFQARIPEWVGIPFFRGSFWPKDRTWISCTVGDSLLLNHWESLARVKHLPDHHWVWRKTRKTRK